MLHFIRLHTFIQFGHCGIPTIIASNQSENMATELELTRQPMNKGEEVSYTLHFIKDCDCGENINEHLLPNSIREPDLTSLFSTCVNCLICANTRLDSKKFVSMLIRSVGKYSEIAVENRASVARQIV